MDERHLSSATPMPQDADRVIGFEHASNPRSFAGISVSADCRRVDAVVVGTRGRGLEIRIDTIDHEQLEVPDTVSTRFKRLRSRQFESPGEMAMLARELADCQSSAFDQIAARTGPKRNGPFAIGVIDPGLWHFREGEASHCVSLCDAARLARLTGHNVVEGFAAADLASGGLGGPLGAIPHWALFQDPDQARLVLDLGRTARLTYLPPARSENPLADIVAFDVGPGTNLLDYLALRFSSGQIEFDPGGRLAVQGRCIEELITHWVEDSYFQKPLPRWNPVGLQPYDELEESVRMAAETGWSVRDLLCTATHFIVRAIAREIERHVPQAADGTEIVLAGGGSLNGLLLSELAKKMPQAKLVRLDSFGIPDGALDATIASLLASLHVDRVPANLASVTGTESPGVLGRLSPGSPQEWTRLVANMTETTQPETTLRRAV